MIFDFDAVKARISIETLFREDGYELKRSGNRLRCLSPFQKEKTPSCYVDADRGRFKCFSSGNSGDIFDYVMLTRGCDNKAAYDLLAARAGVVVDDRIVWKPLPADQRPAATTEEKPLEAIGRADLCVWMEGVMTLKASPSYCTQIASWRGYSSRAVMDLANHEKIGLVMLDSWLRKQDPVEPFRRVAFPVEGFIQSRLGDQELTPALLAYHVRLLPREKKAKAGWRYMPSGSGSWPYVLGDPSTAVFLIICEGQWDGIALFDALGVSYDEMVVQKVAIAAMRGAANWRLFVEHYLLRDGLKKRNEAKCLLTCDGDMAGETWATPDGDQPCFAQVLQELFGKVYIREPIESLGKDVNDVWKAVQKAATELPN